MTATGGNLAATLFSIDQGAQAIAASAVTLRAAGVTFTFAAIGASFEGTLGAGDASMAGTWRQGASSLPLALVLQSVVVDRPVVDRSGLPGRYDFTLTWTPDESQFAGVGVRVPPPSGDANGPPGLFTAVQEQLGIRLDSTRAPVEVLIIDRAERPSPN